MFSTEVLAVMNWLHCNNCFQLGSTDVHIHLTSCGHLFCEKCRVTGRKSAQCPVCSQQCSCVPVMGSDQYSVFFKDPADILKSQQQQLTPILEFQRSQMTGLISHYQMQIKKAKHSLEKHNSMERELILLQEENSLLRKENLYLKKKTPQTNDGGHHACDSPSRMVGVYSPAKHMYASPVSNTSHKSVNSPSQKYDKAYCSLREKHKNLLKHLDQVNSERQNLSTELNKSAERLLAVQEKLQVCERVVEEQCEEIKQLQDSKEQLRKAMAEVEVKHKETVNYLTALGQEKDMEISRLMKELQIKEQELASSTVKRKVDLLKTPKAPKPSSLFAVSNVKMTPRKSMWRVPRTASARVTKQQCQADRTAQQLNSPVLSQSSYSSTGSSSQREHTDWLDSEN